MQAFIWTPQFDTGLARVDAQHHHLVDLINTVGSMLVEGNADEAQLEALFDELATYALEHFSEEEALMAQWQVDARHAEHHAGHHREFVAQLTGMRSRAGQEPQAAATLHSYLASWLTMHILGEDQRMARMIAAITQGMAPAQAYAQEQSTSDPGVSALLGALYQLYGLLARQNRALRDSNLQLEVRVAERTQSLLAAEKMASMGRLIAGIAHEMNTPIGVAVGATSNADEVLNRVDGLLAVEEVDGDALVANLAELREGNALALKNLRRASELVQRIRQNTLEQDAHRPHHFALRQCMQDVATRFKAALAQRGVLITIDCPDDLVVYGQALHYEQVLSALIDNALCHAFPPQVPNPHIQLSAKRTPAGLEWCCSDNGVGISEEAMGHVFEPFFTTQRSAGRPGLGLYLCYNLVTSKLGGSIRCTRPQGQGLAFTLHVPMTDPENMPP